MKRVMMLASPIISTAPPPMAPPPLHHRHTGGITGSQQLATTLGLAPYYPLAITALPGEAFLQPASNHSMNTPPYEVVPNPSRSTRAIPIEQTVCDASTTPVLRLLPYTAPMLERLSLPQRAPVTCESHLTPLQPLPPRHPFVSVRTPPPPPSPRPSALPTIPRLRIPTTATMLIPVPVPMPVPVPTPPLRATRRALPTHPRPPITRLVLPGLRPVRRSVRVLFRRRLAHCARLVVDAAHYAHPPNVSIPHPNSKEASPPSVSLQWDDRARRADHEDET